MGGKGISVGQTQPRTCSGGKTLKMCKNKAGTDNLVVIDVDSDNNVILIDVPEFLPTRLPRSSSNGLKKDKKYPFETVICIDDDDENTENDRLNDGQFVHQNSAPVKLSKCKRTYSGKATSSNHYGLSIDSESSSSDDDDDDGPDFEFEGSSGKLKEQWEKAFLKRHNVVYNRDDQAATTRFCNNSREDIEIEKEVGLHADDSDVSSNISYEEAEGSPSIAMNNGKPESTDCENVCEKSTFRGEHDMFYGQSGMMDRGIHPSASHFFTVINQYVGLENKTNENVSLEEKNDVFNSNAAFGNSDSVFFNREMHKETDEYKRLIEEELASRQRELQIQAEEAQNLKRLQKRKKAESMRLLDMERRQKQRVEEMRETQKKDEENLNLKEKLRAEVRKELNRLETTCNDMASILRGLGIHVNGSNQVRAAFKRALLSFHPDRAPQSDIRQQVEAEEKFKLITRMKEKFMLT